LSRIRRLRRVPLPPFVHERSATLHLTLAEASGTLSAGALVFPKPCHLGRPPSEKKVSGPFLCYRRPHATVSIRKGPDTFFSAGSNACLHKVPEPMGNVSCPMALAFSREAKVAGADILALLQLDPPDYPGGAPGLPSRALGPSCPTFDLLPLPPLTSNV
jgi:hypothetical protein